MENHELAIPNANQIAMFFDANRLKEMSGMANAFAKSGAFGKDVTNGYVALAKIQAGFEMGMPPMEAMNSLYIVNGKIGIWGMAQSKLLKRKGWAIRYEDEEDEKGTPMACRVTVSKGNEVHSYNAKVSELKRNGAYSFAPKNKLRWHGLGQIIRFDIPEVMDAGVAYLAEEIEDMEPAKLQSVQTVGPKDNSENAGELMLAIEKAKTREEYDVVKNEVADSWSNFTEEEQATFETLLTRKLDELNLITVPGAEATPSDIVIPIPEQKPEPEPEFKIEAPQKRDDSIDNILNDIAEGEAKKLSKKINHENLGLSQKDIAKTIAGLKTFSELTGYKDYLTDEYEAGSMTRAVFEDSYKAILDKMNNLPHN